MNEIACLGDALRVRTNGRYVLVPCTFINDQVLVHLDLCFPTNFDRRRIKEQIKGFRHGALRRVFNRGDAIFNAAGIECPEYLRAVLEWHEHRASFGKEILCRDLGERTLGSEKPDLLFEILGMPARSHYFLVDFFDVRGEYDLKILRGQAIYDLSLARKVMDWKAHLLLESPDILGDGRSFIKLGNDIVVDSVDLAPQSNKFIFFAHGSRTNQLSLPRS